MTAEQRVSELWRARPRDRFLRWGLLGFVVLIGMLLLMAGVTGEFGLRNFDWDRRLANCQRFVERALPFPVQLQPEASLGEKLVLTWQWSLEQWRALGKEAFAYTLALSVLAIVFAGVASLLSLPLASRRLASPSPLLPEGREADGFSLWRWRAVRGASRFSLVLARSIPEYMIAFFLVVALGYNAWPAVLALAIHNAGILGRLGSELVDNMPSAALASQRALGAGRWQIYAFGAVPSLFSRFLIFFFYRWETCVRDATVLGMLGIPTFGYYLMEARAKDHLDSMLFFVVLGSLAVLLGDLVSGWVRWRVRRG